MLVVLEAWEQQKAARLKALQLILPHSLSMLFAINAAIRQVLDHQQDG